MATPKKRASRASKKQAPRTGGEVVAVTGALGFLGRRLLATLGADLRVSRIIALDDRPPAELMEREGASADPRSTFEAHGKVSAFPVDLTEPNAETTLHGIFEREGVTRVCHLAFLSNPTHAVESAHELESVGTMYVLHAVQRAGVGRVVALSSTMTYGARPDNPVWMTEEHALRGGGQSAFVDDKIDADRQVMAFADKHPEVACAVLRMGAMLGGSRTRNFWTRYFTRPLIATVLGYDPLMQFLHADDAVRGIHTTLMSDVKGAFNLVGQGVLPLSTVIRRLSRRALPMPFGIGGFALGALWNAQLVEVPPGFVDYLRWTWLADGKKLKEATGFEASHDIENVLDAVLRDFKR
jgi:UDP-glucose 4-epimerase